MIRKGKKVWEKRKKGVGEKEKGRSIIKEIESGGPILKVVVVL